MKHGPHRSAERAGRFLAVLIGCALISGCTTFGSVRSADVTPGLSGEVHAAFTSPPGDAAAWFWAPYCASSCNQILLSPGMSLVYGMDPDAGTPIELGLGTNGLVFPFVHGYVQLEDGANPYGIGARVGIPAWSWHEHQLFGRYDIPLDDESRVVLNPSLFLHTGNSPNGANPGTFIAFVQRVGLEETAGSVTFTPAVSAAVGYTHRDSYGRTTSGPTAFVTASMGIRVHPDAQPE